MSKNFVDTPLESTVMRTLRTLCLLLVGCEPNASPEEIYCHAGQLIFRFELTGPIVPYHRGGGVR